MIRDSVKEIKSPVSVKGRISHVQRICRSKVGSPNGFTMIPCPLVVHKIMSEINGRKDVKTFVDCVKEIRAKLITLPYWERCLCSQEVPPSISEEELPALLELVPAHRFEVVYVTSTLKRSFVVGIESLLESVYRLLQIPQLSPCLQRTCEPSIGILKLDLAKKTEKNYLTTDEDKKLSRVEDNSSKFEISSVLIFQQARLLYNGCPLEDYGCTSKDFLQFISKKTKYDFNWKRCQIDR